MQVSRICPLSGLQAVKRYPGCDSDGVSVEIRAEASYLVRWSSPGGGLGHPAEGQNGKD